MAKAFKLYTEEEQYKGKLLYGFDEAEVRGSEVYSAVITHPKGEVVTVVGEYTIDSTDGRNVELKQLIVEGEEEVYTVFEGHIERIEEEKLELGDFVRVVWKYSGEKIMQVRESKGGSFYLSSLTCGGSAFHDRDRSLEDVLKSIKEFNEDFDGLIAEYEIIPKDEAEVLVSRKTDEEETEEVAYF